MGWLPIIENLGHNQFVGREQEMSSLMSALGSAMSGQGRLVMLAGEPGVGKTRIVQELAAQADALGAQVYWGWCYEEAGAPPYWPWIQPLRTCLQEKSSQELETLMGPGAAIISEIVPEVRIKLPEVELPPGMDPEQARFRLFDSLTTFWKTVSSSRPTMVVLEDWHNADRSSLLLLEFMVRQIAESKLLIVCIYRDAGVSRRHPLSQTIGNLMREQLFSRLQLEGLAKAEIAQLVRLQTGVSLPDNLLEVIHGRTNGNPLFLGELMRLAGQNDLSAMERWVDAIPDGVRDIIGTQLSRLSDNCNQILGIASVIGREFPLAVLDRIADAPEGELYSALDEAQSAGVIEERPAMGAEVIYRFVHGLVRETLYEEIIAPRRVSLHVQVARALEQVYSNRLDEHAGELAMHHSFSSEPTDMAKTVEYSEIAAKLAMSIYAYGEAAHLLDQALQIQGQMEPGDIARKCDLTLDLGHALMPGEPQRVVSEIAVSALELAEQLGDRERALRACNLGLWGLRRYASPAFLSTSAFRYWAEQADRHALPGTVERVLANIALSGVQISTGRLGEGITLMRDALQMARTLNHPETLFWATAVLLDGAQAPQHQKELWSLAAESNEWPRAGASVGTLGVFLMHNGSVHLAQGDRRRAEETWAELEELATRTNDHFVLLRPIRNRAILAAMDGRFETALEAETLLLHRAEEFDGQGFASFLVDQITIRPRLYLGLADEALAGLTPEDRSFDSGPTGISSRRALCMAHMGLHVESQALLDEHVNKLNLGSDGDETPANTLVELLETANLLQDRVAVVPLVDRLAILETLVTIPMVTCVARHLGAAAMLSEDWSQARSFTNKALEVATKVRFRPEIALARLQLAEILFRRHPNEHVEALGHLEFATAEFAEMKMRPSLERAGALHDRTEARRPERATYPDGLTEREVDVLRLIASGKTNQEIGDELFISTRTVATHVANILNKIGAANRAESAAYASRNGLV